MNYKTKKQLTNAIHKLRGKRSKKKEVATNITEYKKIEEMQIRAQILENMVEGVNVADEKGIILFTNQQFNSMFGYKNGELIGKHVSVLNNLSEKENARFINKIMKHLKVGGNWSGEIYNRKKDGTLIFTSCHVSSVKISGKQYLISVKEDITERKKAEKELQKTNAFLKSILNSSSNVSIVSTDLEGNILFWNKGAENMLGYMSKEIVGCKNIDMLYFNEEIKKKAKDARIFAIESKKAVNCEILEMRKDGGEIWVNLNITPRLDDTGKIIGLLGVGEDITERRKMEETLKEEKEELEKFIDIAVGRELKMANLQEENEKLKTSIEALKKRLEQFEDA